MMIDAITIAYNASWGKSIGFVVGSGDTGGDGEAEGKGPSVMVVVLLHPLSLP